MTQEEKADEIVKKMYKVQSDSVSDITLYFSKKCALIAVDEIIHILNILPYGMEYLSHIDYWEGVKQEIEKL